MEKSSVYLICGDDEFLVARETRRVVDSLVPESEREFGLEVVDGRVDTVDENLAVLNRLDESLVCDGLFGGGAKTIWLRGPGFIANERVAKSVAIKDRLAKLADAIKAGLADGTVLVVSTEKIARNSSFFNACKKVGVVKDFGKDLRQRDKAERAEQLLDEQLGALGLEMPFAVRHAFLDKVGTNSRQIVSEIEKLACYCGERKAVTAADVSDIVASGAVSEIWDFVDAFGNRNGAALVKQVKVQLEQGENAVRLASSLLTLVAQLTAIRDAIDRKWAAFAGRDIDWGGVPDDVAAGLDADPKDIRQVMGFRAGKLVSQARNWTVRDLRAARHHIVELREKLVSSGLPESVLLETQLLKAIGIKRKAQ